ncbi:MAG: NADH-quinone oxidoreductase subunit NuoE [Pseudomonadota bacterium]
MSVRRLAKDQPTSFEFGKETLKTANWWIAKYPAERKQSAVIPLLWLVQKQEGWVSEPAIRVVADMLGMAVIRVLEVATFYTMFQLEPVGRVAFVQLCGTTPCMLCGANDLKTVLEKKIGPKNHVSADGRFSWEEVECLGACSNAPMAAINDYYYEDLTPESLAAILDEFAAGGTPRPGSRIGRGASEPKDAIRTLLDPALYDGSRAKKIRIPNLPEKPKKAKKEPAG